MAAVLQKATRQFLLQAENTIKRNEAYIDNFRLDACLKAAVLPAEISAQAERAAVASGVPQKKKTLLQSTSSVWERHEQIPAYMGLQGSTEPAAVVDPAVVAVPLSELEQKVSNVGFGTVGLDNYLESKCQVGATALSRYRLTASADSRGDL